MTYPRLAAVFLILMILAPPGCARRGGREGKLPPGAQPVESDYRTTEQKLYSLFQEWKGTPYRSGGLSKGGVDCSGFVYRAYRDRFAITLPRTVKLQSGEGARISRRELRAGDLVFFKTGFFQRHVGIYLEDGSFMHASSGRGVTMSNLDGGYWSRRFWKARRLLE